MRIEFQGSWHGVRIHATPGASFSRSREAGHSSLYIWIHWAPQLVTALSEGRGYGEAGGEGLFWFKSSESLTHPDPSGSPLSRKRARAVVF